MVEWVKYDGDRDKVLHDIKLFTGEIIPLCYPNANSWNPLYTYQKGHGRIDDDEVEFISTSNISSSVIMYDGNYEEKILNHLDKLGLPHSIREDHKKRSEESERVREAELAHPRNYFGEFAYMGDRFESGNRMYSEHSTWIPVTTNPEQLKKKPAKPYVYSRGKKKRK